MMSGCIFNADGTVTLVYEGEENVVVSKEDYDRAFGTMCNSSREAVLRDYGIKDTRPCGVSE